jgi:hypothetical protein
VTLAMIALWAVARLWLGSQGVGRYGWLLLYLIVASFAALLGWQGATATVSYSLGLGVGISGPWVYGPGVAVTFAGLALAALGLVGAFASRWRQARRR